MSVVLPHLRAKACCLGQVHTMCVGIAQREMLPFTLKFTKTWDSMSRKNLESTSPNIHNFVAKLHEGSIVLNHTYTRPSDCNVSRW